MLRKKIIIGNWKMNGSFTNIKSLCESLNQNLNKIIEKVDITVCVPSPYLDYVQKNIFGISLGAQNVSQYDKGAFTGEISVHMLKEFGCKYVLLGHSERRIFFSENNNAIIEKAKKSLEYGLIPIICIGETLEQRLSGNLYNVLVNQLESFINVLSFKQFSHIIIAYEPVWAIGGKSAATLEQIEKAHTLIRTIILESNKKNLAEIVRIIYGGTLKASNASDILFLKGVDGGLVGGSSLNAKEFSKIINGALK